MLTLSLHDYLLTLQDEASKHPVSTLDYTLTPDADSIHVGRKENVE